MLLLSAFGEAAELTTVPRLWGVGEVRWTDEGRSATLETFAAPVAAVATEVSPDGRWGFFWHRADGRAREVSVYDLRAGARIATFTPGFGGELHFTAAGPLVHRWGCGTNCSNLLLYDRAGNELLGVTSSGTEVSPSRRYAASFPTLPSGEEVVVYDLGAARVSYRSERDVRFAVDDTRWEDGRLVLAGTDDAGERRRLVVDLARGAGTWSGGGR